MGSNEIKNSRAGPFMVSHDFMHGLRFNQKSNESTEQARAAIDLDCGWTVLDFFYTSVGFRNHCIIKNGFWVTCWIR